MNEIDADKGDRGYIEWKPNKRTVTERAQLLTLINSYKTRGLPAPTGRDLMYDMIGVYGHKKSKSLEKKVYRLLRKMRRSKLISFEDITDTSEAAQATPNYPNPLAFFLQVESKAKRYEFDLQKSQPCKVEVFTEGAGKVQQVYQLTRAYHIPVRSPGGYDSIAPKRALALRAAQEYKKTGRQTVVLHCGDFDPDGLEIYKVLYEDAYAFLKAHLENGTEPEEALRFDRILTHHHQVMELPPERRATFDPYEVKDKNHRGKRWPYGFTAQLESVGLERMLPIVKDNIEALLDLDQLSEDRKQSEEERKDILSRVGVLVETVEDKTPPAEEIGVVPEWAIEQLTEHAERDLVQATLWKLPEKLSHAQHHQLAEELRRRIARKLRQQA